MFKSYRNGMRYYNMISPSQLKSRQRVALLAYCVLMYGKEGFDKYIYNIMVMILYPDRVVFTKKNK